MKERLETIELSQLHDDMMGYVINFVPYEMLMQMFWQQWSRVHRN